jgi:hypothetical protein
MPSHLATLQEFLDIPRALEKVKEDIKIKYL